MTDKYPHTAGHYGIDTSIAAAEIINDKLAKLQTDVLGVITEAGESGVTADEIAARLGWERFRVRPRTSELRRMRKIGDSGLRRPSQQGVASIVWVLARFLDREVPNG